MIVYRSYVTAAGGSSDSCGSRWPIGPRRRYSTVRTKSFQVEAYDRKLPAYLPTYLPTTNSCATSFGYAIVVRPETRRVTFVEALVANSPRCREQRPVVSRNFAVQRRDNADSGLCR